jgi:hypothetical protein
MQREDRQGGWGSSFAWPHAMTSRGRVAWRDAKGGTAMWPDELLVGVPGVPVRAPGIQASMQRFSPLGRGSR